VGWLNWLMPLYVKVSCCVHIYYIHLICNVQILTRKLLLLFILYFVFRLLLSQSLNKTAVFCRCPYRYSGCIRYFRKCSKDANGTRKCWKWYVESNADSVSYHGADSDGRDKEVWLHSRWRRCVFCLRVDCLKLHPLTSNVVISLVNRFIWSVNVSD